MHKHPIIVIMAALLFVIFGYWFAMRSKVSTQGSTQQDSVFPLQNELTDNDLTEQEARIIAEQTCIKGGESLAQGYFNAVTRTWWFDANLNMAPQGCNPACVVSNDTRAAEINWRCTGVLPPDENAMPEVTNFEECVAAGYPVLESNPRQCTAEATTFIEQQQREDESSERVACAPSQRGADVCVQIYDPVCADVQVECIKAPCPPIAQTFGNACEACRNARVSSYVRGACESK